MCVEADTWRSRRGRSRTLENLTTCLRLLDAGAGRVHPVLRLLDGQGTVLEGQRHHDLDLAPTPHLLPLEDQIGRRHRNVTTTATALAAHAIRCPLIARSLVRRHLLRRPLTIRPAPPTPAGSVWPLILRRREALYLQRPVPGDLHHVGAGDPVVPGLPLGISEHPQAADPEHDQREDAREAAHERVGEAKRRAIDAHDPKLADDPAD